MTDGDGIVIPDGFATTIEGGIVAIDGDENRVTFSQYSRALQTALLAECI